MFLCCSKLVFRHPNSGLISPFICMPYFSSLVWCWVFSAYRKQCTKAHHLFPTYSIPPEIKRFDERLTLVSLGSWNDVSSCPFNLSNPWQHWQGHPHCWHFSPPSPDCPPCLLWPASPANVAIYKNSWDRSADQAFLHHHRWFNRRRKSRGVLTIFPRACEKEGESQSTEQPPPVLICLAHCVSWACTIPRLALDAEHVCQPHQQLGALPKINKFSLEFHLPKIFTVHNLI